MTKQEALKIVEKLGFTARNGKELFYKYRHKGVLITTTAIPKGKGQLHIENDFRQQLRVSREQLALAKKCPFGAEEYLKHLAEIGLIEEEEESKPPGRR
jgi:hypothetical protein